MEKAQHRQQGGLRVRRRQCVALGLALLLVGGAIYVFFRAPGSSQSPVMLGYELSGWVLAAASVFPAFAHTAGFSLLTAGLVGTARAGTAALIGLFAATNVLFEIGQYPAATQWLEDNGLLRSAWVAGYLRHGTFDPWDLVAIGLAVIAAWGLSWRPVLGRRLMAFRGCTRAARA